MSDPHEPGTDRVAEEVGDVGEEAAKLLGALSDWARGAAGAAGAGGAQHRIQPGARWGEALSSLAEQAAATVSQLDAHIATGSAECSWCPVCRTVHAVRRTSPEVRAHLATAGSSFLQAMAGLLATVPPPDAGRRTGEVERIDLDDPDDEAGLG